MDIGYVQNPIFTTNPFYTLKVTAVMLNVAVPISIQLWKPDFEGSKSLKIMLGGKQHCLSREAA